MRQRLKRKSDTEFRIVESISLGGVDTVFEIVLCAFILSIVILILEKIHFNYHEKKERQRRNNMIALFIRKDNRNNYFQKNISVD